MMMYLCVVLAVLGTVRCDEEQRNRPKRFAAAYAGFPFSFAGAGFPFGGMPSPWDYPRAGYVPFPYVPFPVISIPKPWYEGENVCKEVKYANAKQADPFGDFIGDDFSNVSTDYSSEHESCQGNNNKFVCTKRVIDNNGEMKMEATKYQCCHGFIRVPSGPGCMENVSKTAPIADEKIYYGLDPEFDSDSSSSSNVKSVDKVPIQ